MHQYIERETSRVVTEKLIADKTINQIYSTVREKSPFFFNLLTSARTSELLGFLNYDNPLVTNQTHLKKMVKELHIDLSECLDSIEQLNSPRKLFERKIRFWETRPLPEKRTAAIAPADSRILVGSFAKDQMIRLKSKFFHFDELVGKDKIHWRGAFQNGDFAVCRLTPDKYHYNHVPVSGRVVDFYEIDGAYHSCNPTAVVSMVTPYSKNKRTVTIIDTDVEDGSQMGMVMMVELVALMIGEIEQCYSLEKYNNPVPIRPGMFIERGCVKSLFRPGSSVVVLIFQQDRVSFYPDIMQNLKRKDVISRYSSRFQQSLVETDIKVRSPIAKAIDI